MLLFRLFLPVLIPHIVLVKKLLISMILCHSTKKTIYTLKYTNILMASAPWLMIGIGLLLIVLALLYVRMQKINKRPTDYYNLFIIGIIWLPIGIVMDYNAFLMLGLIFTLIGIANKDKWKKNRVHWGDYTDEEKKFHKIMIGALSVLVLIGVVVFYLSGQI